MNLYLRLETTHFRKWFQEVNRLVNLQSRRFILALQTAT